QAYPWPQVSARWGRSLADAMRALVAVMPVGWPLGPRSSPPPRPVVLLMISLVDPMPIVYRGLHRGRSAANIPKGWNLVMSRALLLVAVKAPFGASRALGFLAAAHGVAHAAPITSCQFEDGNPDGLP